MFAHRCDCVPKWPPVLSSNAMPCRFLVCVCFDMTINLDSHMLLLPKRASKRMLWFSKKLEGKEEGSLFVGFSLANWRIEAGKHCIKQCAEVEVAVALLSWRLLQTCCHQVAILCVWRLFAVHSLHRKLLLNVVFLFVWSLITELVKVNGSVAVCLQSRCRQSLLLVGSSQRPLTTTASE